MAMEVTCSACQGLLLVETPGVVVACPHCGAHLQAPDHPAAAPVTDAPVMEWPLGSGILATATKSSLNHSPPADTGNPPQASARDLTTDVGGNPLDLVAREATPLPVPFPDFPDPAKSAAADVSALSMPDAPASPSASAFFRAAVGFDQPASSPFTFPATGREPLANSDSEAAPPFPSHAPNQTLAAPSPGATDSGRSHLAPSQPDRNQSTARPAEKAAATVPRSTFVMLASYASAVTLAALFLLYRLVATQVYHPQLESLPDIPVEGQGDKSRTTLMYIPTEAEMNPRHTLHLGESERYGSLRVTPLRVAEGFVRFQYFDPSLKQQKPDDGPLLKLHLKFENVSKDQEFVPLDRELVFARNQQKKKTEDGEPIFKTNNFVCRAKDKGRLDKLILPYDLSDSWTLQDQGLGTTLAPGQSLETFIASSADNLESLQGSLIWRVHFRKGYNPQSQRGVTTLIEVAFNSDEITDEPELPPLPPPPPPPPPKPSRALIPGIDTPPPAPPAAKPPAATSPGSVPGAK